MSLWKQQVSLDQLNALNRNTLGEALGIHITEVGDDYVRATMPGEARTHSSICIASCSTHPGCGNSC